MRFSNRELRRLMKRAGIKLEEVGDVKTVEIHLKNNSIIRIYNPIVAKMVMPNQVMYQITGEEEIIDSGKKQEEIEINEEDIKIVMEQTGVDKELALKALEMTEGDIAEAIMILANF